MWVAWGYTFCLSETWLETHKRNLEYITMRGPMYTLFQPLNQDGFILGPHHFNRKMQLYEIALPGSPYQLLSIYISLREQRILHPAVRECAVCGGQTGPGQIATLQPPIPHIFLSLHHFSSFLHRCSSLLRRNFNIPTHLMRKSTMVKKYIHEWYFLAKNYSI